MIHNLIDAEQTKQCKTCLEVKTLDRFYPNKSCKYGVNAKCRDCSSIRLKAWYAKTRLKRQQEANARSRARKKIAIDLLGGKCFDCQGVFDNVVYDFHHINDDKEGNMSDFIGRHPSKIEEELKKCVLLCANCHRIRHKGP